MLLRHRKRKNAAVWWREPIPIVSALASQNGGLNRVAAALGYASVKALQDAIAAYCADVPG